MWCIVLLANNNALDCYIVRTSQWDLFYTKTSFGSFLLFKASDRPGRPKADIDRKRKKESAPLQKTNSNLDLRQDSYIPVYGKRRKPNYFWSPSEAKTSPSWTWKQGIKPTVDSAGFTHGFYVASVLPSSSLCWGSIKALARCTWPCNQSSEKAMHSPVSNHVFITFNLHLQSTLSFLSRY